MTGRAPVAADLVIGAGHAAQTVQIHAGGRLRASAVRTGTGWMSVVDGTTHQVRTLDELLAVLGVLPDHHRRPR